MGVNRVDILAELAAWGSIDLLNALETTALNKCLLCFRVLGEHLGELRGDVGEDVIGGEDEQGFEGGKVRAHLDNILEGLLRFVFQVGRALSLLHHVDGQEAGGHVGLGQILSVVWRVTADLAEGPGGGGLDVVLWLVDQGVLEWSDTLGHDDSHCQRVIEGRDVAERHDAWQTCVTLRLADVVDGGSGATRVHNEFSELRGLFCDLTDASGGVFAHLHVNVLQAVEDSGEDLSLHDNLGQVNGVFGDLSQALADVALELGIRVRNECGKVGNGTLVDDGLGELLGVLGDLREGGCGDALEGELGLLNAEDEKSNSAGIDDRLGKVGVVLGDA